MHDEPHHDLRRILGRRGLWQDALGALALAVMLVAGLHLPLLS